MNTPTEFDRELDKQLHRLFEQPVVRKEVAEAIKQAVDKCVIGENKPDLPYGDAFQNKLRSELRQSLWGDK